MKEVSGVGLDCDLGISRDGVKTANESPRKAAESGSLWKQTPVRKATHSCPLSGLQIWRKGGGSPGELQLTTGNLEAQAVSQLYCREGLGKLLFPPLEVGLFSCKNEVAWTQDHQENSAFSDLGSSVKRTLTPLLFLLSILRQGFTFPRSPWCSSLWISRF